jgi:hypothetical protein
MPARQSVSAATVPSNRYKVHLSTIPKKLLHSCFLSPPAVGSDSGYQENKMRCIILNSFKFFWLKNLNIALIDVAFFKRVEV